MSRIAYVNGRYLLHGAPAVPVEDRGYQLADGVYEVMAVERGRMVDVDLHFVRLERSLAELRIAMPMSRKALESVLLETIRRNGVADGIVYLQVNRGVARRDHAFPAGVKPSVVVTARRQPRAKTDALALKGVSVISTPDLRWARVDIKAVGLLPNVLAKQQAREAGAYEAWLVDRDGLVTEGSSTNAWIVDRDGNLVTRQWDGGGILNGVTRLALMDLARERQIRIIERAFSVAEAQAASEAFLTSTTAFVMPIVQIDGKKVGAGVPGPVTAALRALYVGSVEKTQA